MTTLLARPAVVSRSVRPHWLGDPVEEFTGPIEAVASLIPSFDRVPFGTNRRLDMIVRRAESRGDIPVPTAVVSKRYVLVQHLDAIGALLGALEAADIDPTQLHCRLKLTESGARMVLRVELPRELDFTPPDGHRMALTFECFNSVDGTVPFFALLGWLRFVCSNGLVIGTTHARMRRYHVPSLDITVVKPLLAKGIEAARVDRNRLAALSRARVPERALDAWVDGPVRDAWGPFAAARVYSIATTGWDGVPVHAPVRVRPSEREVTPRTLVPGANAPCEDRYALAQALAWVAAQRREIAASLRWRAQIGALLERLD